jgi:hypothetical protein
MRNARPPVAAPVDLRYPIGPFKRPAEISSAALSDALLTLGELPQSLRTAVHGLHAKQLDTPYREGGWTVRQLVHHIADSHMNCYVRIKLALTEAAPTIKPYDEAEWAMLRDGRDAPIEWSLDLLEALHARLLMLLRSLSAKQWQRTFVHPENGALSLETVALLYAWHSKHHVAHITTLRSAKDW